jgi:hypothetical protein
MAGTVVDTLEPVTAAITHLPFPLLRIWVLRLASVAHRLQALPLVSALLRVLARCSPAVRDTASRGVRRRRLLQAMRRRRHPLVALLRRRLRATNPLHRRHRALDRLTLVDITDRNSRSGSIEDCEQTSY